MPFHVPLTLIAAAVGEFSADGEDWHADSAAAPSARTRAEAVTRMECSKYRSRDDRLCITRHPTSSLIRQHDASAAPVVVATAVPQLRETLGGAMKTYVIWNGTHAKIGRSDDPKTIERTAIIDSRGNRSARQTQIPARLE